MTLVPVLFVGLLCIQGGGTVAVNRPPEITCPRSKTVVLDTGKPTVSVTWDDPIVFDQEDATARFELDAKSPAKGSEFGSGIHYIKYRAYDKKDAEGECVFGVHVDVATCPQLVLNHGSSDCTLGAINGQVCTITCHEGYETPVDSEVKCQGNGTYTSTAKCAKLDYYRKMCNDIESSKAATFTADLDADLTGVLDFLRTGYIASYKTFEYLRNELCINEESKSKGGCIFLRRYDLVQRIKADLQKIPISPAGNDDAANNMLQYTYRRALLAHPEIRSFCHKETFFNGLLSYFPDYLRFDSAVYMNVLRQVASALTPERTTNLRADATATCTKVYRDPNCLLKDVIGIVDRARIYLGLLDNAANYETEDITWFKYAVTFGSVIMKWKYLTVVDAVRPANKTHQMNCVTEIIRALAKYIDEGKDNNVIDLMSLFPQFETDKICNTGTMCLFWRVVDQSHVYVKTRKKTGPNSVDTRMINIQLDKQEFLKQKQMERILQLLVDQSYNLVTVAEELKKEFTQVVNTRFSELKDYFKKVHKFSAAVAAADMIVMYQLENLTKSSVEVASGVDVHLGLIVSMAITAAIGEVVEKTVSLAMTTAESCNPFDPSPSEALEAASELANAVALLEKAINLGIAMGTAVRFSRDLKNKFGQNKEFITVMNSIKDTILNETTNSPNFRENKDKFLESYNGYTPAVTKPEITELGTYMENVATVGCDLINDLEGITAATVKALESGVGACSKANVGMNKLIATLEEIYDKQYEFVDVILANVKAQVGLEAADGMLQGYTDLSQKEQVDQDVLQNLKQTAGMSYIVYRIMVIQVIRMYCDELEYQNGGVRPDLCRDSRTDIATLLAYKGTPCQTVRYHYQSISNYKKYPKDKSYFDIPVLYSGVPNTFHIPNTKWLHKYGWINEHDVNSVLYLQGFEIYLPTRLHKPRVIRVEIDAVGDNELVPGGTRYKLLPIRPMVYEYVVGDELNCRQTYNTIVNPYSTCKTKRLPEMCPYTERSCMGEESRGLYPSLFSSFRIRVSGYEDVLPPDPATILPIKVAVKTCIVPRSDMDVKLKETPITFIKDEPHVNSCCDDTQYWDSLSNNCQRCPTNSIQALNGYYCRKKA